MRYVLSWITIAWISLWFNTTACYAADTVLWQGQLDNTPVRIIVYDADYMESWSFEYKALGQWQRLEDTKAQVKILREICKK